MDEIWIEKYRPINLSEVVGQPAVTTRLKNYVKERSMPHLLFAGPAGIGKTTSALALARELFGDLWKHNLHELNASDERGIDVVRGKIKEFARTAPLGEDGFKIIFLDEADALTNAAQAALRRTMEKYARTCRFVMSCNYSSKIIEPIQSRCAVFRFRPLEDDQMRSQILHVAEQEGLKIEEEASDAIVHISLGDLRKAITALQVAAGMDNVITRSLIYETSATAPPEILQGYLLACKEDGFQPARRRLRQILDEFGLAGTDLVNQLHRELGVTSFLTEETKLELTEWMAEIDHRLVQGGGEHLQLDAMTARICALLK